MIIAESMLVRLKEKYQKEEEKNITRSLAVKCVKKISKSCNARVVQVKTASYLHSFNDDWNLHKICAKIVEKFAIKN